MTSYYRLSKANWIDHGGMSVRDRSRYLKIHRQRQELAPVEDILDIIGYELEELEIAENIASDYDMDEHIHYRKVFEEIDKVRLTERERFVFFSYIGKNMTFEDIAECSLPTRRDPLKGGPYILKPNVEKTRISQIYHEAVNKIKRHFERQGMLEDLELYYVH